MAKHKKLIQEISDFKIALIATILPVYLMAFWQINNSGLPLGDAGDFIGTAGAISNLFLTGTFLRVYINYLQKNHGGQYHFI